MKKLIEKHQQKNGRGRGVIQFSPETQAYIQSQLNFIPKMNTTSNISVQQANQRAKQQEKVDKDTKAGNKRIADKHAYRAVQERDQRRRTPNVDVTKGYSNGTIQNADKVNLDKVLSWYGLSNGLGQMTNVSNQMRNTPQFGNQMGQLYGDMAKVGLTTGLGAAVAPTLVPGGSFWTKGINWLNPSKYLGRGQYTTALGGQNASLFGAAADAGLASYGAAEALQHFYNNPDLQTGTMAILAGMPLISTTRPTLTAGQFEHYFNQGKFKTYKDLLKYRISEDNAKKLFKLANDVKSKLGYFTSKNLKAKDFDLFKAITDNTENNLFGKKGANDAIKKVLLDPQEIEIEKIRNRTFDKNTGETIWERLARFKNETGIDWRDDPKLNSGNYFSEMDNDFKLGYVGGNDKTPFIQRYYDNVINHIIGENGKGFQYNLIKSGDLRKTSDGKRWEALLRDGKYHEIKHPEEYVKVRYAQSKGANVDMPIPVNGNDLYPMHGTRDKDINYLTSPSSQPGQMGYWTFIRNSKYAKSDAPGHYKGTGYSVPFFWTRPKYETDPMLPYGNNISNSYGKEAKELFRYMLNQMKVYRPKNVKDSAAPRGMVDEYNFGPQVPNPKSSWNTLDFEPGAGPFAYNYKKNTNNNSIA